MVPEIGEPFSLYLCCYLYTTTVHLRVFCVLRIVLFPYVPYSLKTVVRAYCVLTGHNRTKALPTAPLDKFHLKSWTLFQGCNGPKVGTQMQLVGSIDLRYSGIRIVATVVTRSLVLRITYQIPGHVGADSV